MGWMDFIGDIGGALIGADAARKASNTQADATREATGVQQRQFDLTRMDLAPFRAAGKWGLSRLLGAGFSGPGGGVSLNDVPRQPEYFDPQAYLAANPDVAAAGVDPWKHWTEYGFRENRPFPYNAAAKALAGGGASGGPGGPAVGELDQPVTREDVMMDPGYQFGLTEGQKAIDRKIASGGGRLSGAAIKAAGRFGTDYASSGFNAAYQRKQDRLNRLAALAGIGQTATNSSAQAGAGTANAISGLLASGGDAAAAGQLARGNIWGNAFTRIAAGYGRDRAGGSGGTIPWGSFGGGVSWSPDPQSDPWYMGP